MLESGRPPSAETRRDLPDADVCWKLESELALPAYVVEKLVWKKPVLGGFD
jgi:hypothetical protein